VVLVTPEGFQYLERTYGSLTQVARAITGQHRSGPHFFDLPKSKPPPPRSPTKTLVKLCIVGHDEALIASLQAQLREAGHAVAVAYNNNAGLHRLGADIFDALFVGQTCAVIGSTSVIPWIRKLYPDLWIVVLCKISKAAELELSAEVQELGADRCLNQPFSEAELQALLLEIAAKRR
jgi:CheY-like chemotaxis protein